MNIQERSIKDRRSGKNRRRYETIKQLLSKDPRRRNAEPRRSEPERRSDWIRVTQWSSIDLKRYAISKYLNRASRGH